MTIPTPRAAAAARGVADAAASSSRDEQPALWALEQDYTGPDGRARTAARLPRARARRGVRPGPDPPARAHAPGPEGGPAQADPRHEGEPLADLLAVLGPAGRGHGGARRTPPTRSPWGRGHRRRRHRQPRSGGSPTRARSTAVTRRWRAAELLIADGHHRYETARVYAEEIGGEGPHRYVLMCLVALEDPGLTVFPTHRLVRGPAPRPARGARRRDPPRLRDRAAR